VHLSEKEMADLTFEIGIIISLTLEHQFSDDTPVPLDAMLGLSKSGLT